MAIKIYDMLQAVTADGILADSTQVKGGYMAITSDKRANLTPAQKVIGTLVYETDTNTTYRYNGSEWKEVTISKSEIPDWNQNDENAADYVKNRTHFIESEKNEVLIELTNIEMEPEDFYYRTATSPFTLPIIEGNKYLVTFDGADYICYGRKYNKMTDALDNSYDYLLIGDVIFNNGNHSRPISGSNLPFCIVTDYFKNTNDFTADVLVFRNESATHSIKIVDITPTVSKLPEEFLMDRFKAVTKGSGEKSAILGLGQEASGHIAIAGGQSTVASGWLSIALGLASTAKGAGSLALGQLCEASGTLAIATGNNTVARATGSYAGGKNTKAFALYSTAQGEGTQAGSKAFTILSADYENKTFTLDSVEGLSIGDVYSAFIMTDSSSEQYENYGAITEINGNVVKVDNIPSVTGVKVYDPAQDAYDLEVNTFRIVAKPDVGNRFIGANTFVAGDENKALSKNSAAFGVGNVAYGSDSFVAGNNNTASYSATSLGRQNNSTGHYSTTAGWKNNASGSSSVAMGYGNTAEGVSSATFGDNNKAIGKSSMAEGHATQSIGDYSHSEGNATKAEGVSSHTEGHGTKATGDYSHASGYGSQARKKASYAEGTGTIANGDDQHVQGRYNIADIQAENKRYAHIVGNGTDANNRSNAHTLDWSGNAWFAGKVSASSIRIGNTEFTEAQLLKILNFIETIEVGGN